MLTDEQLREIAARAEAATEITVPVEYHISCLEAFAHQTNGDAKLYANAHYDIPALISHIRELEQENARLRASEAHNSVS